MSKYNKSECVAELRKNGIIVSSKLKKKDLLKKLVAISPKYKYWGMSVKNLKAEMDEMRFKWKSGFSKAEHVDWLCKASLGSIPSKRIKYDKQRLPYIHDPNMVANGKSLYGKIGQALMTNKSLYTDVTDTILSYTDPSDDAFLDSDKMKMIEAAEKLGSKRNIRDMLELVEHLEKCTSTVQGVIWKLENFDDANFWDEDIHKRHYCTGYREQTRINAATIEYLNVFNLADASLLYVCSDLRKKMHLTRSVDVASFDKESDEKWREVLGYSNSVDPSVELMAILEQYRTPVEPIDFMDYTPPDTSEADITSYPDIGKASWFRVSTYNLHNTVRNERAIRHTFNYTVNSRKHASMLGNVLEIGFMRQQLEYWLRYRNTIGQSDNYSPTVEQLVKMGVEKGTFKGGVSGGLMPKLVAFMNWGIYESSAKERYDKLEKYLAIFYISLRGLKKHSRFSSATSMWDHAFQ